MLGERAFAIPGNDAPLARHVYGRFISKRGTSFAELPYAHDDVLQIVPRALAAPGDYYDLVAYSWLGGHAWSNVISAVAVPGPSMSFDLPSSVPPVTYDGNTVRWFGAEDADAVFLFVGNETTFWDIVASRRWLSGRTSYTFDLSDVPGTRCHDVRRDVAARSFPARRETRRLTQTSTRVAPSTRADRQPRPLARPLRRRGSRHDLRHR